MKKILFTIVMYAGLLYTWSIFQREKKGTITAVKTPVSSTPPQQIKRPLRLVYLQDVSLSILSSGVELVSSRAFNPLFENADQPVEINFGIISALSTNQMITVSLPAANFYIPALPNIQSASITRKRQLKEEYNADLKKYQTDSTIFFTDRKWRIKKFSTAVDSIVNLYKNHLTTTTDISNAITVTDKVFNSSVIDSAENILILNSDGLNTTKTKVPHLSNSACIILVNAGVARETSIDDMITITFQSTEQAIQYIINYKLKKT